ncbi:MAG TPA: hypothetical protein VG435_10820 [Acidimicrobiales bacterium]|jgi:hypothetical protein|nr:hypothetical protein [Acidimicrobiales bacterium]
MRSRAKVAVVGAGLLAAVAFAVPAHASQSGSVTISLNTSGPVAGRTLLLYDTSGQPLSTLNLSSGTNSFVAEVQDSNESLSGFTVEASMSDLYGYDAGSWSCSAVIPSSAVSIDAPTPLLDINGLGSTLTPAIAVTGNLTTVLGPLLTTLGLGSAVVTDAPVTGLVQTLSQGQVAGGNTGQIVGSTVSSLASDLPIQLASGGTGTFDEPAADPTGANCGQSGASAKYVNIMKGTANAAGLVTDLQGVLSALPNTSVATLISNGYLDSNSVISAVASALDIPINLLSPYTTSILNLLTASLSTSAPLVSGLTSSTGNYASSPALSVNTTGVPNGSYRGTLTITEVDG